MTHLRRNPATALGSGSHADDPAAPAMARALELAWGGWGRVAPNPLVGAVVVRDDRIIGEGFHREFGDRHAEAVALEAAGDSRGATLSVTLEPCRHQGKQPPCVPAILAAGIRRVAIAVADPNPSAAGGAAALRHAGIDVVMGVLGCEAARQNAIFLHQFAAPDRPYVALKLATSIDGRLADLEGRSRWLSGGEARAYVHWLRAGFDAIGVGGQTARVDDPALTVRGEVTPRVPPARVVFSDSADLPAASALRSGAGPIRTYVVGAGRATEDTRAALEADGLRVMAASDLGHGLTELRRAGVASILIEGGGRLASALLAGDLVDRFYWIQTPRWLGNEGVSAFGALPSIPLDDAPRWSVIERRPLGEDTVIIMDRTPCSPD